MILNETMFIVSLLISWPIFALINALILGKITDTVTIGDVCFCLMGGPIITPIWVGTLLYYKPVVIWKKKTAEELEQIKLAKQAAKAKKKKK